MKTSHVYLYVENDELNRQALTLALTRMLAIENLYVFEDSTDFLARVEALPSRPDVFLLDIQMKPYDGFEMLKMLREQADFADTRIVAVTASVMDDQVELLRRSGFDGCIGKPLNLAALSETLKRITEGEKVWQVIS